MLPNPFRRALLALPLFAGTARAHAIIRQSSPALGEAVPAGPVPLLLVFNSRLDHARSQLSVAPVRLGGGGTADEVRVAIDVNSPAAELHGLTAPLAPGAWRIRWQVLALDGHITRGDIAFTVNA
jgi:copper resistance protein C